MDNQNIKNLTMPNGYELPYDQFYHAPQTKSLSLGKILLFVIDIVLLLATGIILYSFRKIKNDYAITDNSLSQSEKDTHQNTKLSAASATSSTKLNNLPNKELLGENNAFAVYLLNSNGLTTLEKTGEIVVYDKTNDAVINIKGTFSIYGATVIYNDSSNKYLLLSTGTSSSRTIIPLSLETREQIGKEFCATSNILFWQNYIIYGNCDAFSNRPWEAGQAASLIILSLSSGLEKVITKSDLTHQYGINKIEDNILYYFETYVANEADWQDQTKTIKETKSLDLQTL